MFRHAEAPDEVPKGEFPDGTLYGTYHLGSHAPCRGMRATRAPPVFRRPRANVPGLLTPICACLLLMRITTRALTVPCS